MRPALRPVAAAFVGFGFFAGSFAVAAIDIERTFRLSDAGLGFLLAVGILTATAIAAIGGALTDRIGASALFVRALAVWGALLLVEAGAPNLVLFVPAFALATGAGGLVDVVMNILAADALSTSPGRLVRFHGLFNAGAVMGAVFTGIVLRLDVSWRVVWAIVAIAAFATAVVAPRAHIPDPPRGDHVSMWRALVGLRHEGLLVLALVFAASAIVEGGVATWGVLYLRAHLGVGVLAGVGAYAVGAFLATLARIGGGTRVGALGTRRAVAIEYHSVT